LISKILVVEDESIEAMNFEQSLKSFGYEVVGIASTGEGAIKMAAELKPDLVLMDIVLKGNMDGIEVAAQIRQDLDIPLVYLTAHPEESAVKRAKLTFPYGYLIKPVNKTDLKNAIEIALYKHQMEIKLKESESKYRMLFDNSQVSTAITSMDGHLIAANEKFLMMIGYASEELQQVDLGTMYQNINQRNFIIKKLKEEGEVREYEVALRRRDGHPYINLINVDLIPYRDEEAMLVTAIDITKRKKAEENLKKSESFYKAIFENTGTASVIIEEDTTISLANREFEKLSGYTKEELEGKKHWTDFVVEEDLEKMIKYHYLRRDDPKAPPITYDFRFIDRRGIIKNIHLKVDIIPGTSNSVASLLDTTNRKKAEKKIRESLKEKEILLKEIHHRVKNNLQIISSLLELQESYVKEDPTAINVLKESQNRVLSMAMIHEMLYQSRDLNNINFSIYLQNLISNLFVSYGVKSSVKPTIHVEDIFLNIETSVPLGLIVSELVSNSLKYAFTTKKVGELLISLKSSNKFYELIISDDGSGFPDELDFRKAETSLGLRLVNSLVDQLEGTIGLDRSHGTKFTIKFRELDYKNRI
jgi:PAS domain S-box-containing protein